MREAGTGYLVGIDGLRGLAVAAVLLYHADLLPGGFLGVEVFFVISGYLITRLLLQEWRQHGRIDLAAFWVRRARRLLPAAWALIVATLAFVAASLPDELAGLRGPALAGLVSVSNWYAVLSQQSYFEAVGRPPLLRHLWSLGIEWQFYVVWPPLLLLGLRRWRPGGLARIALAAAVASTIWMALLDQPGADLSRLYYGTDTRASGLLLGAALALWCTPHTARPRAWRVSRRLLDGLGLAGLGSLALLMVRLGEFEAWLYRGGFATVGLATAATLALTVETPSRLGAWLAWPPLRWTGVRSYGIYLWHWPVFMLTRPLLDVPLDGWPLLLLRLVLVGSLAEVSYRVVESPIRHGRWSATWRSLRLAQRAALSSGVLLGILVLGTSVAAARPPERPAYLSQDALNTWADDASTPVAQAATAEPAQPGPDDQAPPTPGVVVVVQAEPTDEPAAPLAPPTVARSRRVRAIGDSVMLGAAAALSGAIDGIAVDAAINRQAAAAIEILRLHSQAGDLGDVVVVHIGNNGTFSAAQFDQMMEVLRPVPRVVFVNLRVPRAWEQPNNAVLADGVARYPNTALVDWHAASGGQPALFWDDGIHLRPAGAAAYATLVADQVAR